MEEKVHDFNLNARRTCLFVLVSLACLVLSGAVPGPHAMRGPFPIMSTPYFDDGSVDCEGLAREVKWVAECGCPGVIWCQSNDAVDLLSKEEKFIGFEACATAAEGLDIVMTFGANGTNTVEMLELAAEIERVAERHPRAKIAMISRPPHCETPRHLPDIRHERYAYAIRRTDRPSR